MLVLSRSQRQVPSRSKSAFYLCVVALLSIASSACSSRFVYNRLDTLAGWYVQSLVSLDDAQRTQMRTSLQRMLEWHRESELDQYAMFLRETAEELAQPLTRAQYERAETRFEGFWTELAAKTAPDVARFLLDLTPAQLDELTGNLEERARENGEEEREELAEGTWHKDRAKDIQSQLKRWTGSASAQQKSLIEEAVQQFRPTSEEWSASQQQWRTAVREALADRTDQDAATRLLIPLLSDPRTQWTDDYVRMRDHNREQALALVASLDAALTEGQRERLRGEIVKLAEQLESIAERR